VANNAKTEEQDRKRSRRRLWILIAVFVLLVGLTVAAFEVTSQPFFCAQCHEMQPAVAGWREGNHEEFSCFACHSDPGVVGYLKAKIVDGLWRDVRIHLLNPPEQVADSFVPNRRCLRCHGDEFEDEEFLDFHPTGPEEYCPECHRDEIHENERP